MYETKFWRGVRTVILVARSCTHASPRGVVNVCRCAGMAFPFPFLPEQTSPGESFLAILLRRISRNERYGAKGATLGFVLCVGLYIGMYRNRGFVNQVLVKIFGFLEALGWGVRNRRLRRWTQIG